MTSDFEITDTPPTAEDCAVLSAGLDAYNASRGAPNYRPQELSIIKRARNGKPCAGLTGKTFFDWLYIDTLWVDESLQKHGLGTKLVQRAEEIARQRGCVGSYLWTMSYQAPSFYQRLGYKEFVALSGCPDEHQRLGFMKRLAA